MFVNAIMYYKVKDATSAVANVDDYSGSAQLLAATTLRNVLGTRNLGDILSEREAIAQEMQSGLDEATDPWGVLVERVEVKDVRVPENLQRAMAAEAAQQHPCLKLCTVTARRRHAEKIEARRGKVSCPRIA